MMNRASHAISPIRQTFLLNSLLASHLTSHLMKQTSSSDQFESSSNTSINDTMERNMILSNYSDWTNDSMFSFDLSSLADNSTEFMEHPIMKAVLFLAYAILVIVSLVGNGLVCRVLLRKKPSSLPIASLSSHTGTSKMLIINLAVSDLLLTCFNIPINLVRFYTDHWPFGSIICTMMPFIQSVSAHCSAWTMVVISFERYRKIFQPKTFLRIHHPSRPGHCNMGDSRSIGRTEVELTLTSTPHHQMLWQKLSPSLCGHTLSRLVGRVCRVVCYSCCVYFCCCLPQRWLPASLSPASRVATVPVACTRRFPAWFLLGAIWTISLLLSLPHSFYSQIIVFEHTFAEMQVFMTRCRTNLFPDKFTRRSLTIYTMVTQYGLPIGITTYCYLHIGIFLWRREGIGFLSERRRLTLINRKRRRLYMLILVVITFAICWLPLNLYILLTDFNLISLHMPIFFGLHWFAMSSVCYNPFIYCWLNDSFRQKMSAILKCFLWNKWCKLCCPKVNLPSVPSVSEQMHGRGTHRSPNKHVGWHLEVDHKGSLASWTSTTMSATGQQQAISELISMSALLEQELVESKAKSSRGARTATAYSKEARLALMTTQSGRRRYHPHNTQLMMMINMPCHEEPATKTTSVNLDSSFSSSSASNSLNETEDPETNNTSAIEAV